MVKSVDKIFGSIVLSTVALMTPSIVSADDMSLTFLASGFTITGDFSDYQNDGYVLITENGTVHIPAAMVSCEGDDCVAPTQLVAAES